MKKITEVKKIVKSLNSLEKRYDELMALKRYMEKPENIEFKNVEQLQNIDRQLTNIEKQFCEILNIE